MEKAGMVRAEHVASTGKMRNTYKIQSENLNRCNQFEDLDVDVGEY
jgi:hypothetical protein